MEAMDGSVSFWMGNLPPCTAAEVLRLELTVQVCFKELSCIVTYI